MRITCRRTGACTAPRAHAPVGGTGSIRTSRDERDCPRIFSRICLPPDVSRAEPGALRRYTKLQEVARERHAAAVLRPPYVRPARGASAHRPPYARLARGASALRPASWRRAPRPCPAGVGRLRAHGRPAPALGEVASMAAWRPGVRMVARPVAGLPPRVLWDRRREAWRNPGRRVFPRSEARAAAAVGVPLRAHRPAAAWKSARARLREVAAHPLRLVSRHGWSTTAPRRPPL